MQSSDEWGQNYQDIMPDLSFDETFDITDFAPGSTDSTSSPKVSPASTNGGGLFPKGCIGKPIRRRSRASKRVPTTLLTADANNFRALVQQFTGCHSAPPAFGAYKGPINLNFERANCYTEKPEESDQSLFSFGRNKVTAITTTTTTMTTAIAITTTTTNDRELFVSRINDNSRGDALTIDEFDIDNLSIEEMSGGGDYSGVLPGTRNDDLWGY